MTKDINDVHFVPRDEAYELAKEIIEIDRPFEAEGGKKHDKKDMPDMHDEKRENHFVLRQIFYHVYQAYPSYHIFFRDVFLKKDKF